MENFKVPEFSKSTVKQILAGSAVAVTLLLACGNAVHADANSNSNGNQNATSVTQQVSPATQTANKDSSTVNKDNSSQTSETGKSNDSNSDSGKSDSQTANSNSGDKSTTDKGNTADTKSNSDGNVANGNNSDSNKDDNGIPTKNVTFNITFMNGTKFIGVYGVHVQDMNNKDEVAKAESDVANNLPKGYKLADGTSIKLSADTPNYSIQVVPTDNANGSKTDNSGNNGSNPSNSNSGSNNNNGNGNGVVPSTNNNGDGSSTIDSNGIPVPNKTLPSSPFSSGDTSYDGNNANNSNQSIDNPDYSGTPVNTDLTATKDMPWNTYDGAEQFGDSSILPISPNTDLNGYSDGSSYSSPSTSSQSSLPDTGENNTKANVLTAIGTIIASIASFFGLSKIKKLSK